MKPNTSVQAVPRLIAPLVALLLAGFTGIAMADDASDVSRLIKTGQLDQALARADAFLASKPKDAQMRFLKGLVLTEQNKTAEAVTIFTKLTEDYPELPEPYNNLAVLYAGQGQYDKARTALEMAIRTHPSYATAHENLGDVYAKLASQSYDKALQLDTNNAAAQTKLAMIRDLIGGKTRTAAPAGKPVPTPLAQAPVATAPAAPVVAVAPAAAPSKPAAAPAAAAAGSSDEVMRAVNDWAAAWSNQDVQTYLGYYGEDFDAPGGNRKKWESERRRRIEGKGSISVKIDSPSVSFEDGKAVVRFKQTYTSDRLSNVSDKVLVLVKNGGKWQIIQERAS